MRERNYFANQQCTSSARGGRTKTSLVASKSFWILVIWSALLGSWYCVIACSIGGNETPSLRVSRLQSLGSHPQTHTENVVRTSQVDVGENHGAAFQRQDLRAGGFKVLQQLGEQRKRHSRRVFGVSRAGGCQAVRAHVHVHVVLCSPKQAHSSFSPSNQQQEQP